MNPLARRLIASMAVLGAACAGGPPPPAALDTRNDTCASCRMAVSAQRFAAQLVAPAEEPRFFDDLGCLRTYLDEHPTLPAASVAYVADHGNGVWVLADQAVYSHPEGVETPMGGGFIAHASAASRAADTSVQGAPPLTATDVFGAGKLPSARNAR